MMQQEFKKGDKVWVRAKYERASGDGHIVNDGGDSFFVENDDIRNDAFAAWSNCDALSAELREAKATCERLEDEVAQSDSTMEFWRQRVKELEAEVAKANKTIARVESALACEDAGRTQGVFAEQIRKALNPPPTALELLARIEANACGAGVEHYNKLREDMAELRRILEEQDARNGP